MTSETSPGYKKWSSKIENQKPFSNRDLWGISEYLMREKVGYDWQRPDEEVDLTDCVRPSVSLTYSSAGEGLGYYEAIAILFEQGRPHALEELEIRRFQARGRQRFQVVVPIEAVYFSLAKDTITDEKVPATLTPKNRLAIATSLWKTAQTRAFAQAS